MSEDPRAWWRTGVLYQLYPRSFADSNGDGVGDLRGIAAHLDHLEWLGVRGFWTSPITPSSNYDWGYDVTDYTDVDADLGSLADADALIEAASERGLHVILDLVPNHTSTEHPWFAESRSSRDNPKRDWYVWADARADGSLPNNWQSFFDGAAWRHDPRTGQYYLSHFLDHQADLNWWHPEVRAEFERVLRFWFDRGVAGFRIDVANMLIKDRALRDNGPDELNANQPELHDIYRRWRAIADEYDPPRLLIGETPVFDMPTIASFYGSGDELDLAFNFIHLFAPFDADTMPGIIDATLAALPAGCQPVWAGGNHDLSRVPTRWAGGDPARARAALVMLLTLPGTPFLYMGDELLLTDSAVARNEIRDPLGLKSASLWGGRDPQRTPMPWSAEPGAGFTDPGVTPWLPFGDPSVNVADQRDDPYSALWLTRDLVALRDATPELHSGGYRRVAGPEGWWCYVRGERVLVAINLSGSAGVLDGIDGVIRVSTLRARDGLRNAGALALEADEAVIVALDI